MLRDLDARLAGRRVLTTGLAACGPIRQYAMHAMEARFKLISDSKPRFGNASSDLSGTRIWRILIDWEMETTIC